ncbi:hypothetical protein Poly51_24880 [Rubripirellula tenax]|uniref:DUF389 domain-containing protein n=1 Tax=Rubripirellula tenax TaxID=2528015 RepID=A0A5C6F6G3_9BACT|nr:DUF389 domain-containing protein [Rubripirellula tenax]TWU56572.1 hypothetical protein Poly51_24880 [Rubripirellula tenax]
MSVVLVIGCEDEFRLALPWCQRLARQNELPIQIVIRGLDRKVLTEQLRRSAAERLETPSDRVTVSNVDESVDAVLEVLVQSNCKKLLICYQTNDHSWQQNLFERATCDVMWIHVGTDDNSNSLGRLFAVDVDAGRDSIRLGRSMLGIVSDESVNFMGDESSDIANEAVDGDLVLVGVDPLSDSDSLYQWARKQISQPSASHFAILRDGDTLIDNAAARIRKWFGTIAPPMDREQRMALAQDVEIGSRPNLEFFALISAAAMLAAFGLVQDSAAVIIGAMLIAPLMTPIMGAGLALAHGNRPLFESSLLTIVLGFVGALLSSILMGWMVGLFQELVATDEMWARCRPSPLDFGVGMIGGLAASYARTRSHLSSALAGAAIAAALVPPISTAGLQIAMGNWHPTEKGFPIAGPLLLVSVNVLTIMIGSSFILWARGMRSETKIDSRSRWSLRILASLLGIVLLALIWLLRWSAAEVSIG